MQLEANDFHVALTMRGLMTKRDLTLSAAIAGIVTSLIYDRHLKEVFIEKQKNKNIW